MNIYEQKAYKQLVRKWESRGIIPNYRFVVSIIVQCAQFLIRFKQFIFQIAVFSLTFLIHLKYDERTSYLKVHSLISDYLKSGFGSHEKLF